ncbi:GntR family transcriptional regulator [Alicyclobacillus fodiniaquatilis]|uniref:GntR family transcriptional regulator n=1 Tax=Alicyclobacillus fodiniaquatilis TaxID=1661150 RepID=A0ABW4JCZ5_9BACL
MKSLNLKTTRKGLGELAYEAVLDSIISLELKPGQMVSEFEVASHLGVSRTPIREAFRMLTMEDLIEVLPQRGARIAPISVRKVEETRFVRECLEVNAFKIAAQMWDAHTERFKQLEHRIRSLFREQKLALQQGERVQFLELDEDFHRMILELTENQTLLTIVTNMRGHLNRVRYLSLQELSTMAELVNEHEAILNAMISNDEDMAGKLLEHHLRKLTDELPHIAAANRSYFVP